MNGLLENVPIEKVAEFEHQLIQLLHAKYQTDVLDVLASGKLTDDAAAKQKEAATQVAGQF